MEVSALLFDTDDVLFDDTAWHRWLLQLLGRLGLRTHYRTFINSWRFEYLDEVHCGKRGFWDALRCFLQSLGLTAGQTEEVMTAAHARRETYYRKIRPLPGVLATTAKLRGLGVPMGVLCNSASTKPELAHFLDGIGLKDRFRFALPSIEIGCVKPAPESYLQAIQAMGLPVEQVAFVGHDARELSGAKAVGMPTIAFNHDSDAVADVFLERFDELLNIMDYPFVRLAAG